MASGMYCFFLIFFYLFNFIYLLPGWYIKLTLKFIPFIYFYEYTLFYAYLGWTQSLAILLQLQFKIFYIFRRWNQSTGNCRRCKSDMVGAASSTRTRGRTFKSYYSKELPLFIVFLKCNLLLSLKFTLSKCLDAVMVLGNSHMAMARTNKLAVIASHCQDR